MNAVFEILLTLASSGGSDWAEAFKYDLKKKHHFPWFHGSYFFKNAFSLSGKLFQEE